jgi:hypothetical protein
MRLRAFVAVAGCAVLLVVAGCSSDSSAGKGSPLDNNKSDTSASVSPSPAGPSEPAGTWKHQPGQAGRVQQTLTAAGYECSRHGDASIDLRLCAKGFKQPDEDQLGGPRMIGGELRYFSAPDGTVLFARIEALGAYLDGDWDTMQDQMIKAVLPAQDAAVLAADGDTLTWGKYFKDESASTYGGWLQAAGYDDPSTLSPSGEALRITKEQALAKLTAAKLKCSFRSGSGGDTAKVLSCDDPSFKSGTDGLNASSASLELTDNGAGISNILVQGWQGKFTNDVRAVAHVLPKLSALGDTASVPGIQEWGSKHVDGVPHAAYVGKWLVEVTANNNESSMTGAAFDLNASEEDPMLGFDPSKVGTD